MTNTDGMKMSHVVLKNEDVDMLPVEQQESLLEIRERIGQVRQERKKSPSAKYLVINTDEPYAEEIIAILKRNGHWN